MREDLLELICCPVDKGDLTLHADKRDAKGEILQGRLVCGTCRHAYPIEDGIPNLLPPDAEGD